MKNLNFYRLVHRTLGFIRLLILAIICVIILLILGSVLTVVISGLFIFIMVCLIVYGWKAAEEWLHTRAKEKDLETRC